MKTTDKTGKVVAVFPVDADSEIMIITQQAKLIRLEADNIRKTGVSRTIISTDLGQTINPPVADGFAMFAQRLLDAGFTAAEVRTMAVTNPTRLVEE